MSSALVPLLMLFLLPICFLLESSLAQHTAVSNFLYCAFIILYVSLQWRLLPLCSEMICELLAVLSAPYLHHFCKCTSQAGHLGNVWWMFVEQKGVDLSLRHQKTNLAYFALIYLMHHACQIRRIRRGRRGGKMDWVMLSFWLCKLVGWFQYRTWY